MPEPTFDSVIALEKQLADELQQERERCRQWLERETAALNVRLAEDIAQLDRMAQARLASCREQARTRNQDLLQATRQQLARLRRIDEAQLITLLQTELRRLCPTEEAEHDRAHVED